MVQKSNKTIQEKNMLYEKYNRLIFKVLKDLHCKYKDSNDYEEYYSVASLGLAKAINNITGDWNNASSSYFYIYIRNELVNWFVYKTSEKRKINDLKMLDISEFDVDCGINIESEYLIKEQIEEINNVLDTLPPTHRDMFKRKYGINCSPESNYKIAKTYGISHQAVNEKNKRILEKVRKELINQNNG